MSYDQHCTCHPDTRPPTCQWQFNSDKCALAALKEGIKKAITLTTYQYGPFLETYRHEIGHLKKLDEWATYGNVVDGGRKR